jgi:hypothetical protein
MSALLGAGYDSSDDDATAMPNSSVTTATKVVAAPEVNTEVWSPDNHPPPRALLSLAPPP